MFQEWQFLLAEIGVLLGLSALVGLLAGWLIFGRGGETPDAAELEKLKAENSRLQMRIINMEPQPSGVFASDRGGRAAGSLTAGMGRAPRQLDAPEGGEADDLKRIEGIDPRIEQMCNMLGFWHYKQVAKWSEEEIAWVDQNLQGFNGRVTRDDWVAQAKILAEGGETEFSKLQDAAKAQADEASLH